MRPLDTRLADGARPITVPTVPEPDVLPIAVRVWTSRQTSGSAAATGTVGAPQRKKRARRYPSEALVFDTETRTEASQQLLLGVWRFYRDDPDSPTVGRTCVEEGFFYPDDLPDRDPDGWQTLQAYAAGAEADVAPGHSTRPQLMPLSEWLEKRLYAYGYKHRNRCAIVGFNLPFDFGALASHWSPARNRFRGGWSLGLWGELDDNGRWHDQRYHPRLLLKAIDPRRTLFGWGSTTDPDGLDTAEASKGSGGQQRFIDLRTLVFALTDRSHTLESACAAFGDQFAKPEVTYGIIDEPMLHYAREDVRHTATLYRNCLAELAQHPGVDLVPQALYSPAGIGAAYLRAMNVAPPLEKFSDLDPRLLGWSMSAFYGGRAEARIVRTPVPVVVADFTSMYPAQNALLNTWPLLTAAAIDVVVVTEDVRALLAAPDLTDRLFDPAVWRRQIGVTLVQLDHPGGVVLPVRAGYEPGAADYGIGVNPLTYDGQLWYALPDVLAARLLSDAPITIAQALRLRPRGQQADLARVMLRGRRDVDPREAANPFVAMIEERHRVKRSDLPAQERVRLDLFLKITANATAYGSLARFDRRDGPEPVPVLVYGPGDEPLTDKTKYPEDPGPYCFPPVAAAITAGARLMLALIERAVRDAGGVHAFMDTDSIAIVATETGGDVACTTGSGESVWALPRADVVEILRRFEPLNPYGPDVINDDPQLGRSPWKVEHDSLTMSVWCYAIATKRYALYTPADAGPQLLQPTDALEEAAADGDGVDTEGHSNFADWSEHGLGMYLDPTPQRTRDQQGRRTWVNEGWEWILHSALEGERTALPGWAGSFAVSQFSVSTPAQAGWFHLSPEGTPSDRKPRPFGFGILGQVPALAAGILDSHPAAGFSRDAETWPHLEWYDRHTSRPIAVASNEAVGDDPAERADLLVSGVTPLTTVGNVLQRYGGRPEHKSLGPAGDHATSATTGLLRRRAVLSAPLLTALIGKEGNRLLERAIGAVDDAEHYRNIYRNGQAVWQDLALPVLRAMRTAVGAEALAADLGVTARQVRNWLGSADTPHAGASGNRQRAQARAASWASGQLRSADRQVPSDSLATLYAYSSASQDDHALGAGTLSRGGAALRTSSEVNVCGPTSCASG